MSCTPGCCFSNSSSKNKRSFPYRFQGMRPTSPLSTLSMSTWTGPSITRVGRLQLEMIDDTSFLYTVQFFRNQQLVTTAVLTGRLRGGCS